MVDGGAFGQTLFVLKDKKFTSLDRLLYFAYVVSALGISAMTVYEVLWQLNFMSPWLLALLLHFSLFFRRFYIKYHLVYVQAKNGKKAKDKEERLLARAYDAVADGKDGPVSEEDTRGEMPQWAMWLLFIILVILIVLWLSYRSSVLHGGNLFDGLQNLVG